MKVHVLSVHGDSVAALDDVECQNIVFEKCFAHKSRRICAIDIETKHVYYQAHGTTIESENISVLHLFDSAVKTTTHRVLLQTDDEFRPVKQRSG